MNEKQAQIDSLLTQSFIVTDEVKTQIRENLSSFSDAKCDRIISLLTEAQDKQKEVMTRVLADHPEILDHARRIVKDEFAKQREEAEMASKNEDENILLALDNEINNLNSKN